MNPFTSLSPLILLVLAVSYSVHVIVRFGQDRRELLKFGLRPGELCSVAARRTQRSLLRPLFFVCFTTLIGFASNVVAPIPCVRQIGLLLSIGLPITFLTCFFFTLPFLQITRAFSSHLPRVDSTPRRKAFRAIADFAHDKTQSVGLVTVVLLAISLFGISQIRVQTNSMDWFPEDADAREAERYIGRYLLSTSTLNLFLMSNQPGAAITPENLRRAERLQGVLLRDKEIDGILSLVDYVRQLHQAAQGGRAESYHVPGDTRLVRQYLEVLSDPDSIERLVDARYSSLRFFIRVKTRDSGELAALRERILAEAQAAFAGSELRPESGSTLYFIGKGFDQIAWSTVGSIATSLIFMFFILAYMVRSFGKSLVILVPNVLPIVMTFGIVGLLGHRLDYAVSTVACSLLGIAVDDTIHFTHVFEEQVRKRLSWRAVIGRTFATAGKAMILTTVILCAGMFMFSMAELKWMVVFGTIIASGLILCMICELFMTPRLLQWYYERQTASLPWSWVRDVCRPVERLCLERLREDRVYADGETILELGKPGANSVFIEEGQALLEFKPLRDGRVPTCIVEGPDCLGEFSPAAGPISFYRAVAIGPVRTVQIPQALLRDLARENGHVKTMLHSLFARRARLSGDRTLAHNATLFGTLWRLVSVLVHASIYVSMKHVAFRLFRVRVTWSEPGLRASRLSGHVVFVGNHHTELDGMLTCTAVADLAVVTPSRSPYSLVNSRFWLNGPVMRLCSKLFRLIAIDRSAGKGTHQYGFDFVRNLCMPFRESTLFVYPWGITRPGIVNSQRKLALAWIVENLDATLVPVAMIGMSGGSAFRRLLGSILRPLEWRIGTPISMRELLERCGNAQAAEEHVALMIAELSGGALVVELDSATVQQAAPPERVAEERQAA